MTRDKRKDEAYFSTFIQNMQTKNNENIKNYLEKDNPRKIAYFVVATGLYAEFSLKYSLGENVKNLKILYDKILEYYSASIEEDDIYNITFNVISLGILFETDPEKLRQLYELIQKYKQNDLIFSSLLHPILQTKEKIYPKLRFKRSKSSLMLEKIFSSGKNDVELLLKEYLEKFWYTKENIGDAFNSHKKEGYNYVGYWAWEAAAIVKVLKLDDSIFKDNEYYPYDLVHWNE
jgi:hypothetical protein